jgi:hypothetical protein
VRSIAGCAVDGIPCMHLTYAVCSTMAYAFGRTTFDRSLCFRPQITALKSHSASKFVMVARATRTSRADEEYVQT